MNKYITSIVCILAMTSIFSSCQKKMFDDYYARPDGLAQPIYQELQKKGNFTTALALIDKAGYKTILGTAGYWTFFVPNDNAFQGYFQENGISGVAALDSAKAAGIITYSLVANAYRKDQLGILQTAKGAVADNAYRRKTAYYDFTFVDPNHSGVSVANNRNATYVANDNNNKYIPYFLSGYFGINALTASDYNAFYPTSTFTGFNVAGAKVITADIPAENGIMHEIDKVIPPIPSIDQYISQNPDYSEFMRLLDKLAIYTANIALTSRYKVLTGKSDIVYVKSYPATLAFAPNNEGYLALTQTDAQANGWTMVVPKNSALLAYEKDILANFGTFDAAPPSVLTDLINAHMWLSTIWPRDILTSNNNLQVQSATFVASDIIDTKMLSNGNFYGTKAVQQANVFRTVYGKAYLDPKYSLMTRIFGQTDLKVGSTNTNFKYTLFMMSDLEVKKAGYDYIPDQSVWTYTDPNASGSSPSTSALQERLARIAANSLLYTAYGQFDNLSGEGIAESFGGEYVKFKNNKVFAAGNVVKGTAVTIDSVKTAFNGRVYYTKGLLQFAENTETLGQSIERLGLSTDPVVAANFNYFYQYLINCGTLWIPLTKDIIGAAVGGQYTAFIPTNAAIMQAVRNNLLPGNSVTGQPTFSPTTTLDQAKVINFLLYHIVERNTIAADGIKNGIFPTLLKDINGNAKTLTVFYPGTDPTRYVPAQMDGRKRSSGILYTMH
ncbi:uncharacterized protein DUF4993 [Mucilaginibacter gracilis]|uniref:Uncharacterized protein DUF4993 n=1 Tax=Mucilaginibacter gracilis TaxID=423350 RepID=A0A495IYV1_9SPHI|nr:fasciclin domain-containing protein [Mucilaginibacter gracilis]RKR81009.1 uncharacterized protein DUF4993 [Mucilaginibacter gracilis]